MLGPWRWLAARRLAGPPGDNQSDTLGLPDRKLVPSDAIRRVKPFSKDSTIVGGLSGPPTIALSARFGWTGDAQEWLTRRRQ